MPDKLKNKFKPKKIKKGRKAQIAVDMDSLVVLSTSNMKELKKYAKLKSVGNFTGRQDAEDKEVYNKCNKQDYHILTGNTKDFIGMPKKAKDSGIIGHASPMTRNVFTKLKKLISVNDHDHFFGKIYLIDEEDTKLKKDLSK